MRTRRLASSSAPVSSRQERQQRAVLLHEAVGALEIAADDTVVDATLGGGEHAQLITERLGPDGTFIGFDLDPDAIARTREALEGRAPRIHLIEGNFRYLPDALAQHGIVHINKALYDLGWSGYQLQAGRGFSFLADEPLLMTYAKEITDRTLTAAEIVNEWEENSISDIIFGWGEERYARSIARMIVERRKEHPWQSARTLGEAIKQGVPSAYAHARIHPATKTFQALRIAVNDEMGALQTGLRGAWRMLTPKGRIAVITFHSIEDRVVKRLFALWEKEDNGKRLTEKPIVPTRSEIITNPRARSAKLRVIEKISNT